MDDEIEIIKIKTFLENFSKESTGTAECVRSNVVKSTDSITKHHKANTPSDIELKGKFSKLQKSLDYNEECYSVLSSLESSLSMLLEECLKEQKITRENIDAQEDRKMVDIKLSYHHSSSWIRKNCSSPYFKDKNGFPSQHNEDYHKRNKLGFLNPWNIIKTVNWTEEQKRALENGIKIANMKQSDKSRENIPIVRDATAGNLNVAEENDYDWIKISVIDLNNSRSPQECRTFWINYLHPTINKKRWTENESRKLRTLVEQYQHENWDMIAHDLETGRSAFQCMCHFKIRLSDFCKIKWKESELDLLSKFVKFFCVRNFIPWNKIAWLMDGRATADIYRKWGTLYGDIKKGTFSLSEDILLVAGLKEFGEDWSQIAQYLPNRNNIQVRSRMMVLKGRDQNPGSWTENEDNLLEELVQKYGFGNWKKISTHFLTRNNVQVRTRYKSLMKWKAKQRVDPTFKSTAPRPSKRVREQLRLDGLWETAQKIVENKRMKLEPKESEPQYSVVYELSQILKPRKKPGRKKGSSNLPSSFHKEYYDFFHVAYVQRGGRGKDICKEDKIPTLVFQIILVLPILDAQIHLPTQKQLIYEDCSMLEMDKSVITFLVDRKEQVQDNCKFIKFDDSKNLDDITNTPVITHCSSNSDYTQAEKSIGWHPICSPNAAALIGLRTLLLNRSNVRDQSKGLTLQETDTISASISKTHLSESNRYQSSSKLWIKRIGIIYTWTAFLSKMYPLNQFIIVTKDESNNMPSGEVNNKTKHKGRKKKKIRKCTNQSSAKDPDVESKDGVDMMAEVKQKRPYVKSGKFALKARVVGTTRRNTRLTKTDN